jgi:hypothetical protein
LTLADEVLVDFDGKGGQAAVALDPAEPGLNLKHPGPRSSAGTSPPLETAEMGDEDGGRVVVLFAASLGALGLCFGSLGEAGAADQLFETVGGQEVEELCPVGEVEAFDEACGAVAEQRCTAQAGGGD